MDIKKINVGKLPKDYKEIYNELKAGTDNFDEDVVILFKDEINDFMELLKEEIPEAVQPDKPKETKKTITGKPTNLSQLKKWLKQNIGKKIYVSKSPNEKNIGGERKIAKVQTQSFMTTDPDGKEWWLEFPKASDMTFSTVGFTSGSHVAYVYDKKDVPKEEPKKRKPSASASRTLKKIKKDAKFKAQTEGRKDSNIERDLKRDAKRPGKRKSKDGNTYYEYRPNRVDISATTRLQEGGLVGTKINLDAIGKKSRQQDFQTTMRYLTHNMPVYWSWGVSKVAVSHEDRYLRLTVNGHHHKGYVYIFLNGADLFDVYYTTNRGTIKKTTFGLYFDQLQDVIDSKIERIDDYSFKKGGSVEESGYYVSWKDERGNLELERYGKDELDLAKELYKQQKSYGYEPVIESMWDGTVIMGKAFGRGGSTGRGRDLLFQSDEPWEKRYAKKASKPRTGYKGKSKMSSGGGVKDYSVVSEHIPADFKVLSIRYWETRRGIGYEAKTNYGTIWNDGQGGGDYWERNSDKGTWGNKLSERELGNILNVYEGEELFGRGGSTARGRDL
jgi:hypothetical protein